MSQEVEEKLSFLVNPLITVHTVEVSESDGDDECERYLIADSWAGRTLKERSDSDSSTSIDSYRQQERRGGISQGCETVGALLCGYSTGNEFVTLP